MCSMLERRAFGLLRYGLRHGRDNKLIIWKLTLTDEISLDKSLPVDDPLSKRAQPWILHMLDVNALNFCAFALCKDMREVIPEQRSAELVSRKEEGSKHGPILIAIPNTLDSEGVWLPNPVHPHTLKEYLDRCLSLSLRISYIHHSSGQDHQNRHGDGSRFAFHLNFAPHRCWL